MGSIQTLVLLIGGGLACIFFLSARGIFMAMDIPIEVIGTAFAFVSVRYIGFGGIMLCRPLSFVISTVSLSCRYFTKKWQGR